MEARISPCGAGDCAHARGEMRSAFAVQTNAKQIDATDLREIILSPAEELLKIAREELCGRFARRPTGYLSRRLTRTSLEGCGSLAESSGLVRTRLWVAPLGTPHPTISIHLTQ